MAVSLYDLSVANYLQTLGGVSSVVIGGEKRFAMRLWLDSEKMAASARALGVGVATV